MLNLKVHNPAALLGKGVLNAHAVIHRTPRKRTTMALATAGTADTPFKFHSLYHFPAFFTRQPTIATRDAQLRAWSDLILSYCRHHHLWRLSVIDAIDTPLFYNSKLKKRLSLADAREVLDWMTRREGGERAEWVGKDGQKALCWVYWRRPEEWAGILSDWVRHRLPSLTPVTNN